MNKILVVEDDSRLNQAVCKYLNDCGYETTGVLCASDAYDAMYEAKYDLIISDIMMPEIDGFEFAETVRENGYAHTDFVYDGQGRYALQKQGLSAGHRRLYGQTD